MLYLRSIEYIRILLRNIPEVWGTGWLPARCASRWTRPVSWPVRVNEASGLIDSAGPPRSRNATAAPGGGATWVCNQPANDRSSSTSSRSHFNWSSGSTSCRALRSASSKSAMGNASLLPAEIGGCSLSTVTVYRPCQLTLRAERDEPGSNAGSGQAGAGEWGKRFLLARSRHSTAVVDGRVAGGDGGRKGRELSGNARAALVFYRAELERQVRMEGTVERTNAVESDDYFRNQPRGSQVGDCASRQSEVIAGRHVLEQRVAELKQQFADQDVPPSSDQGRVSRPANHHRVLARPAQPVARPITLSSDGAGGVDHRAAVAVMTATLRSLAWAVPRPTGP